MVRREMIKRYGENAYNDGYKVYTTVTRKLQLAAQDSVQDNVIAYDMRHGYRGPSSELWKAGQPAWDHAQILKTLKTLPVYGQLFPAVVTASSNDEATVVMRDGSNIALNLAAVRWARPYKSDTLQGATPRPVSQVLQPGQQIWVRKVDNDWQLAQVLDVNSSLVSLDPHDGAVRALVGGFDFNLSKFNRATQALRQGLGESKNVVMVCAMRAMGVDYAAEYLQRFGFPAQNIVHTESLALGSAAFTPLQMVRG